MFDAAKIKKIIRTAILLLIKYLSVPDFFNQRTKKARTNVRASFVLLIINSYRW